MLKVVNTVSAYSSVAGAAFFRRLLDEWQRAGMAVRLHEALPMAAYRSQQGVAGRIWRRWQMYGGFAFSSWRQVRRESGPGHIRVVTTNPFFLPALVQWSSAGRGATIHLLYDLYPEALGQAGVLRRGTWASRRIAAITRYALRECAVTVFLGTRLRSYVETTYGLARRGVVIPVGADGIPFRGHEPQAAHTPAKPVVLYCGQMGRMHDVDTVLEILPDAFSRHFNWRFHASGPGFSRLRSGVQDLTGVHCGEALADEAWREAMLSASIALVTIARGAEKVVMPSKTYSALVAGQAILAICVRESDLADLVLEHDCGWVIEPGDTAGLTALLERLAASPEEVLQKRRNAYRVGHELYDMTPIAQQWLELFRELEAAGASRSAGK